MMNFGTRCKYGGFRISTLAIAFMLFLFNNASYAQDSKSKLETPRNLKLVREYSDGKGHIIREVQYDQGNMRVTETIIMSKKLTIGQRVPILPDTMNKDSVMVLVDKTEYTVKVYYRRRMVRNYRAVFGPNPRQNKCMEGDRCTPEGWFKITSKNPQSKYNKFMLLSYPTDSSRIRFNQLKEQGIIPKSARIGGDIGIHGIWKGGDDMIEMGVGWTDGCVALKNKDVEELFAMVGIGTRVFIKK